MDGMARSLVAATAVMLGSLVAHAPIRAQVLEKVNPAGMSTPRTYSHVVRAGKLLFIAGQVGFDEQGKLVGPTMREQIEYTLRNLKTALASQGADFSHVAKITVFVTSIDEYRSDEVQAVRARYFGDAKPASTLLQVVRLADPAIKIEIEAVAVLP